MGEIVGGFKWLIKLAWDAEHDRAEREKLRQQLDEEHHRGDEAHERENLVLRLKVQLLEFGRRLPPSASGAPTPFRLDHE